MHAHLAGGDIERLLAEGVGGGDVDTAEEGDEDPGGDDEGPGGVPKGGLGGRGFVEVAESRDAEDYHEHAEGDEAGGGGEEGPVRGDVASEEAEFGYEEGYWWGISMGLR